MGQRTDNNIDNNKNTSWARMKEGERGRGVVAWHACLSHGTILPYPCRQRSNISSPLFFNPFNHHSIRSLYF
jgi:hypothetical protein